MFLGISGMLMCCLALKIHCLCRGIGYSLQLRSALCHSKVSRGFWLDPSEDLGVTTIDVVQALAAKSEFQPRSYG